jgi:hypothetical protein
MSSWKTGKCSGADFSSCHSERSAAKSRNLWLLEKNEFKIRDVSTPLDMTKGRTEEWQVMSK